MRRTKLLSLLLVTASVPALAGPPPELDLPLTGLAIDGSTPARGPSAGTTLDVYSTWSIADDASSFEARDVVVETLDGARASTWVSLGWFAAGTCFDALRRAPMIEDWFRIDVTLWGEHWVARGGVQSAGDELQGRAVVSLCRPRDQQKPMVMTHVFAPGVRPAAAPAALAALQRALGPARIQAALRTLSPASTSPTRAASVTNRGRVPAVREVMMPWADVLVPLPDDGSIWLNGADLDGVDVFERMAPAVPELSVNIARFEGLDCDAAFAGIAGRKARAPRVLPTGWVYGKSGLDGKRPAVGLCKRFEWGVLLAGVASSSPRLDLAGAIPLLEAIGRAAEGPRGPIGTSADAARTDALLAPRRVTERDARDALAGPRPKARP